MRAYSYFGPSQRRLVSQETWVASEKSYQITNSTIISLEVNEPRDNVATATVDVSFKDRTGTPRFVVTWRLVKERGVWKLDDQLSATRLDTSPAPTPPPPPLSKTQAPANKTQTPPVSPPSKTSAKPGVPNNDDSAKALEEAKSLEERRYETAKMIIENMNQSENKGK